MSSLNSNNEFEGLDDPFGSSGIDSDNFQDDMSIGSELSAPEGEAENFAPAPEEGGDISTEQQAEGENPEGLEFTEEESSPEPEEEVVTVEYKKAHCWDMYSWLLLIAWLALLGGILILWLECPPSEYGAPPYKETSVPVKSAN